MNNYAVFHLGGLHTPPYLILNSERTSKGKNAARNAQNRPHHKPAAHRDAPKNLQVRTPQPLEISNKTRKAPKNLQLIASQQ